MGCLNPGVPSSFFGVEISAPQCCAPVYVLNCKFCGAWIVSKDLQKKVSEGEENPEEQTNTFENNSGATATSEPPQKKIKKADLKKMTRPR